MGEADGQFSPESSSAKGEDLSIEGVLAEMNALAGKKLPQDKDLSYENVMHEMRDQAESELSGESVAEDVDNQQKIIDLSKEIADKINEGLAFLDRLIANNDTTFDQYKQEIEQAHQSIVSYRSRFAERLQTPSWIESPVEKKLTMLAEEKRQVSNFIENLPIRF